MAKHKRENYRLLMTIQTPHHRIEGIRCKVYLPEKVTAPIQLQFFPTEAQRNQCFFFEGAVQGEIKDPSGVVWTCIEAEKVYCPKVSTRSWGFEEETLMIGRPRNLKITHWFHNQDAESRPAMTGGFWLTPSVMLEPAQIIEESYTGNVTVRNLQKREFRLNNGLLLSFSNHFRYDKNEHGETISFPELVAEFEQTALRPNPEGFLADSLERLDDFLLIVSFAARQSCICVGWEVARPEKVTRYYRRELTIPSIKKDHSFNDTLIDPSNFDEFITIAYSRFLEFTPRDFLRQLLWKVNAKLSSVEERILVLFSALETLVAWFRQTHHFETILREDQWEKFSKELEKWLKASPYFQNKETRKYVYEKIPELNRISLRSAFNKLCEHYAVDLHDLWPVFGESEGISLSSLRNKLIHGIPFDPLKSKGLPVACLHLQWTVERLLLAVFHWSIMESRVGVGDMVEDWRNYSRLLSEAFRASHDLVDLRGVEALNSPETVDDLEGGESPTEEP